MRFFTILVALLILSFPIFAQKARIFKRKTVSLVGTHESLNEIGNSQKGFIITRADSNFQKSTVYMVDLTTKPADFFGILGTKDHYDAGLIYYSGYGRYFFTSSRPTNEINSSDDWNLFVKYQIDVLPAEHTKPLNELNTKKSECCLVINDSGKAYFSSNRDGSWDIFQADYSIEEQKFINIQKVQDLSTVEDEWPSYISPENDLIIFSSMRKSGFGGDDLYFATKENGQWQEPQIFSDIVNTDTYEDSGLLSPDMKHFYFSSRREDKHGNKDSNIYRIKTSKTKLRKFLKARKTRN